MCKCLADEHNRWMARAIQLARCGILGAPPNPMVGAVIVRDGSIIGEGYHRKCGEGHAEVNAFASVANDRLLSDARMYVTLEPCSHYGRTPPCARLILEKGIKEVYVGCTDPFSKVAGAGIRMLQEGGVKVVTGILQQECQQLISHFSTCQLKQRPYILLKWAQSADGYIDNIRQIGSSLAPAHLSTRRSLLRIHTLRTQCQAIMVGTNTALLDNPMLSARKADGPQPLRVVIDRKGILPDNLHLFDGTQPTWVFGYEDNADRKGHYEFHHLSQEDSSLKQILHALVSHGIQTLMVEGGSTLLNSFIQENLWDEMHIECSSMTLSQGISAPHLPQSVRITEEKALGTTFLHVYPSVSS